MTLQVGVIFLLTVLYRLTLAFPKLKEHKVNMTRLASISNNHFSFECPCGHTALVPVAEFIKKFGLEARVDEVLAKARCSRCRMKNVAESRIVFVGGSGQAMLGTAVQPKKDVV